MAAEAGRDADALELNVRANVYLSDQPIDGDDRFIFTGTVEQIVEDVVASEKIGAAEVFFDVQFSPGLDSITQYLDAMEQLYSASRAALG